MVPLDRTISHCLRATAGRPSLGAAGNVARGIAIESSLWQALSPEEAPVWVWAGELFPSAFRQQRHGRHVFVPPPTAVLMTQFAQYQPPSAAWSVYLYVFITLVPVSQARKNILGSPPSSTERWSASRAAARPNLVPLRTSHLLPFAFLTSKERKDLGFPLPWPPSDGLYLITRILGPFGTV